MPWPRLCQTAEQSLPGASGGATTPRRALARGGWGGDAEPLRARSGLGAVIARGVAADVVEATRTADGTRVAIKVLARRRRRRDAARLQRADSAALAAPESDSERQRQKPPPFREAVTRELLLQRALPFHKHVVHCAQIKQ